MIARRNFHLCPKPESSLNPAPNPAPLVPRREPMHELISTMLSHRTNGLHKCHEEDKCHSERGCPLGSKESLVSRQKIPRRAPSGQDSE